MRCQHIQPDQVYTQALDTAAENGLCDLIEALVDDAKFHCVFDPSDLIKTLAVAVSSEQTNCVSQLIHLITRPGVGELMQVFRSAAKLRNYSIFMELRHAWPEQFVELVHRNSGTELLSEACSANCIEIVKILLDTGVSIDGDISSKIKHPLVSSQNVEISQLLLKYGVNMERQCQHDPGNVTIGDLALRQAVTLQYPELVTILVKYGAKVDTDLLTFSYGVDTDKMSCFILNMMKGQDLNQFDRQGNTALNEAIRKRDGQFIQVLLENGADVNGLDVKKNSPLIVAAMSDNGDLISTLLERGALINHTNSDDRTALMTAVKTNSRSAFHVLIDAGADVNFELFGHTLLSMLLSGHYEESKLEFIKCLLLNKATIPQSQWKQCLTVIHHCVAEQEHDLLFTLISIGGFPPSLLTEPSRYCMVRQKHMEDYKGVFSPLCMALLCGSVTVAQEMLKHHYLTASDLTLLPHHKILRQHLKDKNCVQCLGILDELSCSPPSLVQLSFISVSARVGTMLSRTHCLESLGLPGRLLNAFLFRSWDFGKMSADSTLVAANVVDDDDPSDDIENIDSEEDDDEDPFVWEMDEQYYFQPLITYWPNHTLCLSGRHFL